MSKSDIWTSSDLSCSEKILRLTEVIKRTAISRSQIYHLMSIGHFPKSIPLVQGGSSVGWLESEIHEWIKERVNARDVRKTV